MDQIGLMDAQIGHGTHCRPGLVKEPGIEAGVHRPGLGTAVTKGGTEGHNITDEAVHDQLSGHAVGLGQTLVMADHQELVILLCRFYHGFTFCQGDGHRLFAQNMLAGIEGCNGQLRMGKVGCTDGNCMNFGICQQLFHRCIGSTAVLLCQRTCTLQIDIIEAQELGILVLRIFGDVTDLGNLAAADNTNSKHGNLPPLC